MPQVKFGVSQFRNDPPRLWARISESLRYFFVGAITLVSATDIIPQGTVKWTTLGLSAAVLALKAIDMGLGVEAAPLDNPQEKGA